MKIIQKFKAMDMPSKVLAIALSLLILWFLIDTFVLTAFATTELISYTQEQFGDEIRHTYLVDCDKTNGESVVVNDAWVGDVSIPCSLVRGTDLPQVIQFRYSSFIVKSEEG